MSFDESSIPRFYAMIPPRAYEFFSIIATSVAVNLATAGNDGPRLVLLAALCLAACGASVFVVAGHVQRYWTLADQRFDDCKGEVSLDELRQEIPLSIRGQTLRDIFWLLAAALGLASSVVIMVRT
ncbi:MAG TPA: hypothetical protein VEK79_12030 [Thermoanaerobaculia bacterium]|nr:hypothetical protein [Thermoanaerobaculia bacterium]